MPKQPRVSNKALVEKIRALTGFSKPDAILAFRATLKAIYETLREGKPATLHGLGTFNFRYHKGRTIPQRTMTRKAKTWIMPETVQPDAMIVRFRLAENLRQRLKKELKVVKPEGR